MPRTEGQSENQLTPVCPETPLLVPVFLSPPRAFSMMCANASDGPYFYGSTSLVGLSELLAGLSRDAKAARSVLDKKLYTHTDRDGLYLCIQAALYCSSSQ